MINTSDTGKKHALSVWTDPLCTSVSSAATAICSALILGHYVLYGQDALSIIINGMLYLINSA